MNMKVKILVAEDEEVNFLYINEVLDIPNVEVIHAWDGKQAIELYKQELPTLIIMDIKMPHINGYEALKEIKAINSSIPIIALTAHALSGDREKALAAGFDAYLSKPVTEDLILSTIRDFVNIN
jgi:CheY-like chemotaxis protein